MRTLTLTLTLTLIALVVAGLAASPPLHAAPAGPAAAAAAAPEPASLPQAKAAFLEGERLYNLGRFEEAIEAYGRAYGLDPRPAFLFNIALAHRRQHEIDGKLEHLLRARELYRNYLKLAPDSPRRAGVEKILAELDARIGDAKKNPPAAIAAQLAPAGPSAPTPSPSRSPPAPPLASPSASASPSSSPSSSRLPPRLAARDASGGAARTGDAAPPLTSSSSASPMPEAASSRTRWYLAGGLLAVALGVAATALIVSARDDPSFDGPPVDLTPR